ncbi:MAG TPA: phosphopantothenoylcysteine decarboxylase, partial [Gaiellaceae bacterium]
YRPAEALATKRPKDAHGWTVELAPTDDVAQALGDRKRPGQVLVVFGAEHGTEGLERKREMLETKHADLVVFNDIGRSDIGFDTAENEVVLVTAGGEKTVAKAAKSVIAGAILDEVERLLIEVERLLN